MLFQPGKIVLRTVLAFRNLTCKITKNPGISQKETIENSPILLKNLNL